MASHKHDVYNHPTPQSIPLQDLSRPPDSEDITQGRRFSREESGGEQRTPRKRDSITARLRYGGRYERLAETSPSPSERIHESAGSQATRPPGARQSPHMKGDDGDVSPLDDHGGLENPLGFTGLTVQHETTSRPKVGRRKTTSETLHPGSRDSPPISPCSTPARRLSDEVLPQFLFTDADTTPLTQPQISQRASPSRASAYRTSEDDRTSFQTVRLSSQGSPGMMLGDDLLSVEPELGRAGRGLRERSESRTTRQQSLSPSAAGSPLFKAGTMVRKMSQRVVNLSNEPEIVEQSIRRSSSVHPERPPMPPPDEVPDEDAIEEAEFTPVPINKGAPLHLAGKPQKHWQQQVNPLKGKALGIFPPNNPLRSKLCDLLVHP